MIKAGAKRGAWGYWGIIVVLALIVGMKPLVSHTLDPDLFWHIRVGEQVMREWHGLGPHPLIDHLSFTTHDSPWAAGNTWVPYSWLAEVAMACLWGIGGPAAILFTHGLLLAAITIALSGIARDATGKGGGGAALIGAGGALAFVIPWSNFRPATFVMLLLAIVMWLIVRDRRRGAHGRGLPTLGAIAFLTILGVNMHMFMYLSPLWCALLCAGAVGEWALSTRRPLALPRAEFRRRGNRYLLWTVVASIAACCTPLLHGMLTAIFHYQFHDALVSSGYIAEMQPFWASKTGCVLAGIGVVSLIVIAQRWRRLTLADVLLLGLGSTLLIMHGRYAPLFAIALTAPLARAVGPLKNHMLERPLVRATIWTIACAALTIFVAVFASIAHAAPESSYPTGAVAYLAQHPETARMGPTHTGKLRVLTNFNWGGYVAWRLTEPSATDHWQVWMDGRTQVRTNAFWERAILGNERERMEMLTDTGATVGVFPREDQTYVPILKALGWKPAYADDVAVVLVAPSVK